MKTDRFDEFAEFCANNAKLNELEEEIKELELKLDSLQDKIDLAELKCDRQEVDLLSEMFVHYNIKLAEANLRADNYRHKIHLFEYEQAVAE